ncbi:ribosomal biogenesis protein LAS1L-like [Diabrotica virgifera virgifera]|uniref:Uncharacterized protein n=1 Tax=Diabrotica virgifera virgifera TaxID=50390 RepID=A0ABM5K4S0_DIAVI|nr:ribosomal biogenesis protein LAS1L-like [Diabrotica virgifera virgifera]
MERQAKEKAEGHEKDPQQEPEEEVIRGEEDASSSEEEEEITEDNDYNTESEIELNDKESSDSDNESDGESLESDEDEYFIAKDNQTKWYKNSVEHAPNSQTISAPENTTENAPNSVYYGQEANSPIANIPQNQFIFPAQLQQFPLQSQPMYHVQNNPSTAEQTSKRQINLENIHSENSDIEFSEEEDK